MTWIIVQCHNVKLSKKLFRELQNDLVKMLREHNIIIDEVTVQ